MHRTSLCSAVLALFLFAAPAAAHRFEARLAPPEPPKSLVSSAIAWACAGPACIADAPMVDAPARLCARFAREVGRVEAFAVDGIPLAADALAKCNARSK